MNHNLPLPNMAGEVLNTKIIHDQVESGEDSDAKPSRRSGRRKIKIEYIEDKNRRHITFSKRKAGIMKKAYELSTLTGTQVLLLVVSETGLVYTFTTTKLQPIVTKSEGKNLIQACLNSPDTQDMMSESKLDEEYIRPSTESTTTTTTTNAGGRTQDKSVSKQVSPQTTSSNSPMITSPNMMRPTAIVNPPVNYNYPSSQPPTQPISMPYNQTRYPPGYNSANLPQPGATYPHAQYNQVPFYSGQHYPNTSSAYWGNNTTQRTSKQDPPYQLKNE